MRRRKFLLMAVCKNDLLNYGLYIYQNDDYFKFSIDSVLLAEFVNLKLSDKKVLDMCCGNCPLLMILSKKKQLNYYGIELQKPIFDLARMSVLENKLDINLINDNVKNMSNYFDRESFDIITCNPPYFKYTKNSLVNNSNEKSIARHEIEINFQEIVQYAYEFLKNNGYFYFVHRTDRFMEFINCLHKFNFSIKRIQFVYNSESNDTCCVLFECVKNGNTDTKVEKPLFVNNFLKEREMI